MAKPLNNLAAANALKLGPGDHLLFLRGSTCKGMLDPKGSGASGRQVVIGAYGSSGKLPAVDGGGATAAVWLANMSYVTLQDLDLSNPGDSDGLHRGVYFTASTGLVTHITVAHLVIHNVDGTASFTDGKTGGGIVGQALGTGARFAKVLIEDNQVHQVSRQGITVYGTTSSERPAATSPWPAATTGLVIQDNTITDVQGDGIVPLGTNGAVVQHNVVKAGNLSGYNFASSNKDCSAGIWTWDANNTLIQHNAVSDMHYGPSTNPNSLNGCDGEAFDVDTNQDGTVIQDNYSYGNAGGFILLCMDDQPHRAVVRYNLSVGDNATFSLAPCDGIDPSTNNLSGIQMYNNTFVAKVPRVTLELSESLAKAFTNSYGTFSFANNIVDATSSAAATHYFYCGTSCTHNLFYKLPPPTEATASVTSNPRFVHPASYGSTPSVAQSFKLRPGSPAIGAGTTIRKGFPARAKYDFFGDPVPDRPSIGFAQTSAG